MEKIIWKKIKLDIEKKIILNQYPSGKTPSILQIMNNYNVGKSTAQRVVKELIAEGIVEKHAGKGCYVNDNAKQELYDKYVNHLQKELKDIFVQAKEIETIIEKIKEITNEA